LCHVGLSDPQNTCFIFSDVTIDFFYLVVFPKYTGDDVDDDDDDQCIGSILKSNDSGNQYLALIAN